jgi:hypothetical protein
MSVEEALDKMRRDNRRSAKPVPEEAFEGSLEHFARPLMEKGLVDDVEPSPGTSREPDLLFEWLERDGEYPPETHIDTADRVLSKLSPALEAAVRLGMPATVRAVDKGQRCDVSTWQLRFVVDGVEHDVGLCRCQVWVIDAFLEPLGFERRTPWYDSGVTDSLYWSRGGGYGSPGC